MGGGIKINTPPHLKILGGLTPSMKSLSKKLRKILLSPTIFLSLSFLQSFALKPVLTTTSEQRPPVYSGQSNPQFNSNNLPLMTAF